MSNYKYTLTVVEKSNGDRAIYCPFDAGFTNIAVVTLQKDGEIRWASIGPMTPADAFLFSDALRLALMLSHVPVGSIPGNIGCGLSWTIKTEGVQ